jgi:hypothetical protein
MAVGETPPAGDGCARADPPECRRAAPASPSSFHFRGWLIADFRRHRPADTLHPSETSAIPHGVWLPRTVSALLIVLQSSAEESPMCRHPPVHLLLLLAAVIAVPAAAATEDLHTARACSRMTKVRVTGTVLAVVAGGWGGVGAATWCRHPGNTGDCQSPAVEAECRAGTLSGDAGFGCCGEVERCLVHEGVSAADVRLLLLTDSGLMPVNAGPAAALAANGFVLNPHDQIEVVGARLVVGDAPTIITWEIADGLRTVRVRGSSRAPTTASAVELEACAGAS